MASITPQLSPTASLRLPETTASKPNHHNSAAFPTTRRRLISLSSAANPPPETTPNPEIELEFIGPKAGADGKYPVERASALSGEKLLRSIMKDSKIELYATYGKLMNCGGGGTCGTCIVELGMIERLTEVTSLTLIPAKIIDGKDLLNERTSAELRYLKKKPESWRLACQTIVGNKENSGKVVVQRLPQWKK